MILVLYAPSQNLSPSEFGFDSPMKSVQFLCLQPVRDILAALFLNLSFLLRHRDGKVRKNLLDFSGQCKSFSGEWESCQSSSFASPSFTSSSSPHLPRQQWWKDMHRNELHKLDFLNSEQVLLLRFIIHHLTARHEYDVDECACKGTIYCTPTATSSDPFLLEPVF